MYSIFNGFKLNLQICNILKNDFKIFRDGFVVILGVYRCMFLYDEEILVFLGWMLRNVVVVYGKGMFSFARICWVVLRRGCIFYSIECNFCHCFFWLIWFQIFIGCCQKLDVFFQIFNFVFGVLFCLFLVLFCSLGCCIFRGWF